MQNNPKHSIARKFVLLLFLSTSAISIIAISFEIYLEYNSELKTINSQLDNIEKANFESLRNALWISDEEQVSIILKGIIQLPDIKYIEISESNAVIFSEGEKNHTESNDNDYAHRSYSLDKTYQNQNINLGTVVIYASLEGLYANLKNIILTTFSITFIQILVITFIIFIVFHKLVGRHLAVMANYTRSLKLEDLDTELALERQTNTQSYSDELSQLVSAINDMRLNLKSSTQEKNDLVTSLANSEEKFRGVLESAADGVIFANTQGEIELINNAIIIMTGYSREELIGEKVEKLIPTRFNSHIEDRNNYFKKPMIRPMRTDTTLTMKRKDNSELSVEISLTPVRTDKGVIVAAMIQDITHRRKTELEKEKLLKTLENKNAELERFTYTASHDLKSPLVTISGFIGLLRNDIASGDSDRVESDLTRISDAAKTMQQLLDDLLALSRIGRASAPRTSVPLNSLINNVISLLSGVIDSTEAIVTVEENLPTILVEEQRFKEVFLNLIENAIKYRRNEASPEISIGMAPKKNNNDSNVFFVSDNGIGIKACYHHKIFGLFDRLDHDIDGNGIGLAIVKRIIEVHDGSIWVESNTAGQGTTFFFTISEKTGVQ